MKKTTLTGLIIAAFSVAMIASVAGLNPVFATVADKNPRTDDPNLVGQSAADLAQSDSETNKGAMGQHSSDDSSGGDRTEHPRSGLPNALGGSPEHPSEVIQCVTGVECNPGK